MATVRRVTSKQQGQNKRKGVKGFALFTLEHDGRKWNGMHWIRDDLRYGLYDRDGFCCVYCGKGAENGNALELDHVISRKAGGTNVAGNLITACSSCNASKGARDVKTYAATLPNERVVLAAVTEALARPVDRKRGAQLWSMRQR